MKKLFGHLKTIRIHRRYVRKMCWKMGLFWQGILHDLSKYSIAELKICKYYTGKKSPHQVCRDTIGYSPSWIHHAHKNKHHTQFWIDDAEDGKLIPIKMPYKYVVESFCDMVGAGKAYAKGKGVEWTESDPWNYYLSMCKGKRIMNVESEYLLSKLLWNLKEKGLDEFLHWYKNNCHSLKGWYERGTLIETDKKISEIINE